MVRRGVVVAVFALSGCGEPVICGPGTELRDHACVPSDAAWGTDARRSEDVGGIDDGRVASLDAPADALRDTRGDDAPRVRPTRLPAGAILLFDLRACPGAWEEVGASGRLLRVDDGDAMSGEEGGGPMAAHDATHEHEFSVVMGTAHRHTFTFNATVNLDHPFDVYTWESGSDTQASPRSHGHGTLVSSMASGGPHTHAVADWPPPTLPHPADLLPRWREVTLCRATRALPLNAPAIALVNADTCPPALVADETFAGRFIRGTDGDSELAEVGGTDEHLHDYSHDHNVVPSSDGHSHTFEIVNAAPAARTSSSGPRGYMAPWCTAGHIHASGTLPPVTHTHSLPRHEGDVDPAPHIPPFVELAVCRAESEQAVLPADTVILYEGECPLGWRRAAELAWAGRYVRGRSSAGGERTGGAAEHTHGGADHDHGGTTGVGPDPGHVVDVPYSSGGAEMRTIAADDGLEIATTHTHRAPTQPHGRPEPAHSVGAGGAVGPVANEPPYRELTLCEPE